MPRLSKRLEPIVESSIFGRGVLFLILLNAAVIGLQTYPAVTATHGDFLHTLDRVIIWLFVLEISLRWFVWTPRHRFLLDGWNLFDFIIIAAGLVPDSTYFSVMRIFRVLRILRAVRIMPSMQTLVVALLKSIPSLGHILFLMLILFYVYGVIGTFLFAQIAPQYFGTLHQSLLTLFQIATLEGWVDVLAILSPQSSGAWFFFISFILMGTFVALNLVVGVIVNNMQSATKSVTSHPEGSELGDLRQSLSRIEARLARFSGHTDTHER